MSRAIPVDRLLLIADCALELNDGELLTIARSFDSDDDADEPKTADEPEAAGVFDVATAREVAGMPGGVHMIRVADVPRLLRALEAVGGLDASPALEEYDELSEARADVIERASRLRKALAPFWGGTDDPALNEWPDEIYESLMDIISFYYVIYSTFVFDLELKFCRLGVKSKPMSDPADILATLDRDRRREFLKSRAVDRIFVSFGGSFAMIRIGFAARRLKDGIYHHRFPDIYPPARRGLANDSANPPREGDKRAGSDGPGLSREALACAAWHELAKEGKTPTVAEVSRRTGIHRTLLYNLPHFRALLDAYKSDRDARKRRMPRGSRDGATGSMEASAVEDDGD